MDNDVLRNLDPRALGRKLQDARRARGLTQEKVAGEIGVARTTLTAIEKGGRRIQAPELIRLAALYGRAVGDFLRPGEPTEPFVVQLRAELLPRTAGNQHAEEEEQVESGTWEFQRLCEDYVELERICGAPLPRKYPAPYQIGGGVAPEARAEDIATAERLRLGLGDGPILDLRALLENDVGLRIFYQGLPSRVAAMVAYTEQLGGCIAVNRKHPPERGRMSLGHDYGHFLTNRYQPEVTFLGRYHRQPEQERFADAFASAFLMPGSGLSRRYNELRVSRGGTVKVADLCTLAHFYFVSVEALTRRLEDLRLIPLGTWERLQQKGFRVREAQAQPGLSRPTIGDQMLPVRYQYLTVEAFGRGDLSEGQLARFLRVDRLEARRIVEELASRDVVSNEGAVGQLSLDFGEALLTRGTGRRTAEARYGPASPSRHS